MEYFRVELDRIQSALYALCCCHRAVCSGSYGTETGCQLRNIVEMAHPADRILGYIGKQLGTAVYLHLSLTVFPNGCTLYLTTQHMGHQLCAVTESQHGNS